MWYGRALAIAVALATFGFSKSAEACSCGLGPARFVTPDDASLPANGRALAWWSGGIRWDVCPEGETCTKTSGINLPPSASEFRIERLEGSRAVAVPHHIELVVQDDPDRPWGMSSTGLLVVATEGLEAGARYRFHTGEYGLDSTTVSVARDRLYGAEGRVVVDELAVDRLELSAGLSCTAAVTAAVRSIRLELPERAQPFASALIYTTTVDGADWRPSHSICTPPPPGRSWTGQGKDLLYSVCDYQQTARALLEVAPLSESYGHWVTMRAELPGTDVVFTAPSVEVDFVCPRASVPAPAVSASDVGLNRDRVEKMMRCDGCAVGRPARGIELLSWLGLALLLAIRRRV
jgi:hypothetical protein